MKWLINYFCSCFCKHKWNLFKQTDFYSKASDPMPVRTTYIFICEKCGSFKKINIK